MALEDLVCSDKANSFFTRNPPKKLFQTTQNITKKIATITLFSPFFLFPYPVYPIFQRVPTEWGTQDATSLELMAGRGLVAACLLGTYLFSDVFPSSFKQHMMRGKSKYFSFIQKIGSGNDLFRLSAGVAGASMQAGATAFFVDVCNQVVPFDILSPLYAGVFSFLLTDFSLKGLVLVSASLSDRFSSPTKTPFFSPEINVLNAVANYTTALSHNNTTQAHLSLLEMMRTSNAQYILSWREISHSKVSEDIAENFRIQYLLRLSDVSSHGLLSNGVGAFLQQKYKEADNFFHQAMYEDPRNPLCYLLHAELLYARSFYDKPTQRNKDRLANLQQAVHLIIEQDFSDWYTVDISRNEVFQHVSLPFVLKRNKNLEQISKEIFLTNLFAEKFPENTPIFLDTPRIDNSYHYLIAEFSGRTLFDMVRQNQVVADDFYDVCKLLGKIHRFASSLFDAGTLQDTPLQDKQHYTKRIQQLLFPQRDAYAPMKHLEDSILEAYAPLNDILFSLPVAPYKDAGLRNWVREKTLVALDFEEIHLVPEQFDVINVLEFGQEYLTQRQKKKAIQLYLSEREGFTGIKKASPFSYFQFQRTQQTFFDNYPFVAAHRHLELLGYCLQKADTDDNEVKQYHRLAQRYHYNKSLFYLTRAKQRQPSLHTLEQQIGLLSDFFPEEEPEDIRLGSVSDYLSLPIKATIGVGLVALAIAIGVLNFQDKVKLNECLPDVFSAEYIDLSR